MKKIIAIFISVSLVFSLFACSRKNTRGNEESQSGSNSQKATKNFVDAISYDMELTLDTKGKSLTEKVSVEVENKTEKPVSRLCIRDMTPEILKYCEEFYAGENDNLESEIFSITPKDSEEKLQYEFGKDKTVIFVSLDEKNAIAPGERKTITVEMKTDIPNRGDRFGYRKTQKGTLFAVSFCFPYLADNENGEWNTDPFFDDGESRSNDLADYTVKLNAPEGYTVAMTGSETTEKGITTGQAESVRDFAFVACDFMEKDTFEVDGITINSYYLEGGKKEDYRKITNAVAKDSVKIFNEKIGLYPYEELDIVPCLFGFGFGGMEYPGLVMINASGFFDGPFYDTLAQEDKVAHEIGHQWFYAVVGNYEYKQAWIDEGFTTVLEKDVYGLTPCDAHEILKEFEKEYPTVEEKEKLRQEQIDYARDYYKGVYLNVPPDEYPQDRFYGDAEYNGGYCFLQEVRLLIGDEKFMELLKEFYKTYSMKIVTTEEVLDFIKTYNNSKKMNEIIDFYFKK